MNNEDLKRSGSRWWIPVGGLIITWLGVVAAATIAIFFK